MRRAQKAADRRGDKGAANGVEKKIQKANSAETEPSSRVGADFTQRFYARFSHCCSLVELFDPGELEACFENGACAFKAPYCLSLCAAERLTPSGHSGHWSGGG
ncbi:hypothetical protein ATANTOWER_003910 [Ataeniobius toweri]|uniref:Uncharacterized protein n=1 Tax=Ataeniobius toweri TaxID=208326 RepID=A0ABU7BTX4_9TELE|nr:hypothetical protein [Ataeniobius toweri]